MAIWEYSDSNEPEEWYAGDRSPRVCYYCSVPMRFWEIEDLWPQDDSYHLELHQRNIFEGEEFSLAEIHGLYDKPDVWQVKEGPLEEVYVGAYVCPACGWWSIGKSVVLHSPRQFWEQTFQAAGALRSLNVSDISIPLEEVRHFLVAKYSSRFEVHPRKFEEVVASVFQSFGYKAVVTAYTGDGGIDIVLEGKANERIGVQVKRYRNRIKVEQIRSFVGALMLGGFTRGIFVTTSDYQSGAFPVAKQANEKCVPIELVDSEAFYDAIKIAQIANVEWSDDLPYMLKSGSLPDLHYTGEHHMNSI